MIQPNGCGLLASVRPFRPARDASEDANRETTTQRAGTGASRLTPTTIGGQRVVGVLAKAAADTVYPAAVRFAAPRSFPASSFGGQTLA